MATPMKIKKTFDCVEFKCRAQSEIYEHIQGMSHEQERAYFQAQAEQGALGEWWKRVKTAEQGEKAT